MEGSEGNLPRPNEPLEDRLLFLQENMVNFVNQYGLPVVEVALVVSKFIRIIGEKLQKAAENTNPIDFTWREPDVCFFCCGK